MGNLNQRFELDHDGNIVAGTSELCGDQGGFLEQVFSQFGWKCKPTGSAGCRHCFTLTHACHDSRELIVYSGNIRNEARNEYEKKIQLGASSDPRKDPRGSTIILGIYLFNKNDSFNDAILVGFPIRDDVNYPSNPSLRGGIRVNGLLQKAKIVGLSVDKSTQNVAFRPEFIFYYLEKLKQFHYSTNGDEQKDLDHNDLVNWPKQDICDWLSIALKLFAERRKEEEWCSDKTDGDANKPRAGYVANKQLRVLSNTSADIGKLNSDSASNIKAWFKNYWNVADGKSWLEGLSDADLSGFGPYIAHLLQPGSPAVAKPAKFSNALEAAVKAVIKPEETGIYDERVNETLKFLGLIGFDWNENFDADDLGEAVNAQRVIKRRLKDMGIKRIQESPTADDGNAPDYLTVNEFLWFVKMNLNRIEKEVQEGKMKPATHKDIDASQKSRKPKVNIKDSEDVLLLRLRAALRTKPFAILAGHSGTGKSRMVRKLAYMTCNDNALRYVLDDAGNIKDGADGKPIPLKEPGNFCMVQVKPNWHDSSDLLGYYSELGKRYRSTDFVEFICKAYAYPNTPFFVCLDEMNLAPVEQYFAEYLSAIESRKLTSDGVLTTDELIAKSVYTKEDATGKSVMYEWLGCTMTESQQWLETYGLTIPRNLFVVGTVNMDETTNQFSRKVLDRAMTIEMTDADFDSFGAKSPELKFDDEYMGDDAVKEMLSGEVQAKTLTTDQKDNLNALKTVLAPTSFAVAYRFANEYALYEESLNKTVGSSVKPNPPGTPEEVLTLPEPAAAAVPAVPAAASPEAAGSASAAEATPAAEEGTAEGAAPAPAKKDPAIPSAFDDMVLMKVLPRISGDEADVKQIFYEGRVVGKKGTRENPADKTLMKILDVSKDTESLRKIAAILDRGGTYLSFWP